MSQPSRSVRAGARFLDPQALARIDNLDLLARTVVEGFINGLHRSPYLGFSTDFAEHRQYMPGDDIRRLDWRVFARTDRFYVKEFEADSNANFTVLLDVSSSMNFGSAGLTKLDYGRFLAACLTYFAHRQRDRIGFVSFADGIIEYVPPSAKHLNHILHAIDRIEPAGRGDLMGPMMKVTEAGRRRGIVVVISDFYESPRVVVDALLKLRYRGHDVIAYQVLDRAEIEFDLDEAANFQDLETGETIPVVPAKLRQQYRELMREHLDAIQKLLRENQVDYGLIETTRPLDDALFTYLSLREKLARIK